LPLRCTGFTHTHARTLTFVTYSYAFAVLRYFSELNGCISFWQKSEKEGLHESEGLMAGGLPDAGAQPKPTI
jgi:hypothetical protein